MGSLGLVCGISGSNQWMLSLGVVSGDGYTFYLIMKCPTTLFSVFWRCHSYFPFNLCIFSILLYTYTDHKINVVNVGK